MTEKGKAFLAEASRNEELKAKLTAIDRSDEKASIQEAIRLAKRYGFELIEKDLTVGKAPAEGAVADDELDNVAGGISEIGYNSDPSLNLTCACDCSCDCGGPLNDRPSYAGCDCGNGGPLDTICISVNGQGQIQRQETDIDAW